MILMNSKRFVEVIAKYDIDGNIRPLTIIFEDGRKFNIDRILDMRQAASLKSGGLGIRYTCIILNKQIYLYYEGPNWFIESP